MQIANGNNGLSFADPRYRHGGGSRTGFSDTVPLSNPSDALVPAVSGSGGAAAGTPKTTPDLSVYANVGLDLYYARNESLTRDISSKGSDGYRKIHQELSRSYESSLSLDFSFLKNFEGAGDKLSKIDPVVFDRWSKEAGDLFSFSKKDFKEFVTATNDLFNEMEKTLGLGSTELDSVAGFFTSQVDRFLSDVQKQKAYLDQNPLGEGKDLGLGLPAILDGIKKDMPTQMASYFEDMLAKNEDLSKVGKKGDPLLEMMRRTFKELLDRLYAIEDKKNENQPEPKTNSDKKGEPAAKPDVKPAIDSFSYSASFRKSVTISALLTYGMENQNQDNTIPAQNRIDKVA